MNQNLIIQKIYIYQVPKLYNQPNIYILTCPKQIKKIKCTTKVNQSLRTKNRVIETVQMINFI